jgi:Zn-finger nucleic acid-binding protein
MWDTEEVNCEKCGLSFSRSSKARIKARLCPKCNGRKGGKHNNKHDMRGS